MPKLLKKLLVSFLLGLTVFFSFTPYMSPAKAAPAPTPAPTGTWYNQSFQEWYGKVYDPNNPSEIFGERYTAAQVQWIIYGLFSFLINQGTGPQNSGLIQCFISNVASINACTTQLQQAVSVAYNPLKKQGVAAAQNQPKLNLWALVFATNRPISGIAYTKNLLQKFSPVSTVRAQSVGTGFTALQPVQGLWTAFRNVSYGLFVIVAIIFAFMIMFRVKLSPQTVITVQSALPKLIIALILVTFSYAIAGFLIDLMYVFIGLVAVIASNMGLNLGSASSIFNVLTIGQPVAAASGATNVGVLGILIVYVMSFCAIMAIVVLINVGLIGTAVAGIATIALLATPGVDVIVLIIGAIAILILIIIVIFMLFKIVWMLVKAFVNILLLTILAPIQITLGTFMPSLSFGSWVKSYVSNLAVFLVTGILIIFSFMFLITGGDLALSQVTSFSNAQNAFNSIFTAVFGSSTFTPIGNSTIAAWPPLLGSGSAGVGLLFVLGSFVIFCLIPKANEIIQSFLSGKPFAYGSGVGEAFGVVGGLGKSGLAFHVNQNTEADRDWERKNQGKTARSRPVDRLLEATILRRK